MANARLLLTAMESGAGKTTAVCALLQAWKARSLSPASCKCGPDYIDPMFHRAVLGVPSLNLDLYLSSEETVRRLLAFQAQHAGVTVLEGAMGYYDGAAMTEAGSAYAVARATRTPAVLVLRAKGEALSLAAKVCGFSTFRSPSFIKALLLNDCTPAAYARLKPALEKETGLPVAGYLPPMPASAFESRHLGLVPPKERPAFSEALEALGAQCAKTVDLPLLLQIAESAPPLSVPPFFDQAERPPARVRLAVARDEAFCFLYDENLRLLRQSGAQLCFFSPLYDEALPADCQGLYLGGGWPELHARALSENGSMRASVARVVRAGLPTLAECGGYLYLLDSLQDASGACFPMAGVLPGESRRVGLRRFGYARLEAQMDSFLLSKGEHIPVHCFHYWDTPQRGEDLLLEKPDGRTWRCGFARKNLFASFAHLYFPAAPGLSDAFVSACARVKRAGLSTSP